MKNPSFFKEGQGWLNQKHLLPKRKNLRNNPSTPETILWSALKNSQLSNRKFRRQHSIKNYITDFYSPQEALVIEIDGDSHFIDQAAINYDIRRTEFFNSLGIRVLRFSNEDVVCRLEGVLVEIEKVFIKKKTTPAPP